MVTVFRIYLLLPFLFLAACKGSSSAKSEQFYTWDGLEPDRWGSVWLMKRYVSPQASISVVPVGASLRDAVAIATPNAEIRRTHGKSNFENLLAAYLQDDDPVLGRIGDIINELEISPWSKSTPLVAVVERQFRNLQYTYNRVDVPIECYAGFFDSLYRQLQNTPEPVLEDVEQALMHEVVCATHEGAIASSVSDRVHEYSTEHVLNLISAERNVVFVDTREDAEFDERHIPGAINLKLREVNAQSVVEIKDADLVIAYCIKDFRGYEVAMAMKKAGVERVGIMNPFGLKGWVDQGLPVVDTYHSEEKAMESLKSIALKGV